MSQQFSDLQPETRALFHAGRDTFSPTAADRVRVFSALMARMNAAPDAPEPPSVPLLVRGLH